MKGTITVELCEDDRVRLDKLITLLEQGLSIKSPSLEMSVEPTPEAPVEPEKPKATMADVQAMVQKLATPTSGKRDEVKRIVNEYAPRVSGIPEDKLGEVMQRLVELGGENA